MAHDDLTSFPLPATADDVRVWLLGSGSQGNAALIEWREHRLLIDAGFELPELVTRIRAADVAPATIDDLVLTHGHRDHVIGAADAARTYGWRVWCTLGTVWRWRALREVPLTPFAPGDTLDAAPFLVHTAPTPHDIDDSSALVVEVPARGVRVGLCTDLGEVTPAVRALLTDLDLLIVESNYDPAMLAAGPYPPAIRARVAGPTGHLGNDQTAALLRDVATPHLQHVVLAHISRRNNTLALALASAHDALAARDYRGQLLAAEQDAVLGPLTVPTRSVRAR